MMTDPIADMLTRIRNANAIKKPIVPMPASTMKVVSLITIHWCRS